MKGKQSAVEKPFHDLSRRLEARERELTQMASEGAKLAEAAKELEAFVEAKKAELDKAQPISAKIDKLRDQVKEGVRLSRSIGSIVLFSYLLT